MSKILIGIHGLGNKPSKRILRRWWYKAIREGLLGIGKVLPFPKFEIIYWADVLNEKPLDHKCKDRNDPYYLQEKYSPAPNSFRPKSHSIRKTVLDILEKQMDKLFLNNDFSVNLSFVSDLLIHKYFRELEIYYTEDCVDKNNKSRPAKDIIREKMESLLSKHKDDDIFFIGHSMGSIIAYDVLTYRMPTVEIDTFITTGSPLGLPVIKSKIAVEQKIKPNKNQKLISPPGIKNNWFNFSDLEDKVAMNYNLSDDYYENSHGVKPIDKIVYNNYQIENEHNPHKSYGYLRTPEFAAALYDFLTKGKSQFMIYLLNTFNYLFKNLFRAINSVKNLISGN
ncbi:MAG: lipase family protein [Bacteroidetes bacterium]|nr:lipase family protein [Bacteroidota bacterium]